LLSSTTLLKRRSAELGLLGLLKAALQGHAQTHAGCELTAEGAAQHMAVQLRFNQAVGAFEASGSPTRRQPRFSETLAWGTCCHGLMLGSIAAQSPPPGGDAQHIAATYVDLIHP